MGKRVQHIIFGAAISALLILGVAATLPTPVWHGSFIGDISQATNAIWAQPASANLSNAASGSVSGYLSSSDWSVFNGKQAALGFTPLTAVQTTNAATVEATKATNGLGSAAFFASAAFQVALGFTPLTPAGSTNAATGAARDATNGLAGLLGTAAYSNASSFFISAQVGTAAYSNTSAFLLAGGTPVKSSFVDDISTNKVPLSTITNAGTAGYSNTAAFLLFNGTAVKAFFVDDTTTNKIPVSAVTNSGTAAYSNAAAFMLPTTSVTAAQMPALTGDVTTSAGAVATTIAVHESIISGNSGGITIAAGVTCYFALPGNNTNGTITTDATCFTRSVMPAQVRLGPFYGVLSAAPGSAKTDTMTVFTNGVASNIVISFANVTTGNDTTHTVTVAAGAEVGIQFVTAASSTVTRPSWGLYMK